MAQKKTKRNLFGFGKSVTYSSRLHGSSSSEKGEAFKAGRSSGDTSKFESWWSRKSSGQKFSAGAKRQARKQYVAGVHSLWEEEKREEKKATRERKQVEKKESRLRTASVVQEVADALVGQGMKRGEASQKARRSYKSGDSFNDLFRRVLAKANPKKFDKCVSKVKKSLKKAKRPGNAYAICTAAGTRNAKKNPLVWSGKQGNATARIFLRKLKGADRFGVEMSNLTGTKEYKAKTLAGAKAIARLKLHEFSANPIDRTVSLVPGASYADTIAEAGKRVARGVTKAGKGLLRKIGSKKNPVDVAVKRYEEFHGFPVNEITEIESKEHRHSVTWGIGRLVALNVINAEAKQLPPLIAPGFKYVGGPISDVYLHFGKDGQILSPEEVGRKRGVKPEEMGHWNDADIAPAKIVWLTAGEDKKQMLIDGGDQSLDLKALGFTDRDWHDSMFIGTILRVWYRTRKKFEGDEEVDFYHDFGKEGSRGIYPILIYKPKNPSLEISGGRYEIALPDKGLGGVSPGIVG